MEELWTQDFRREAEILGYKYRENIKKGVEKFLKEIAEKQTPPEGENLFGWMDASGVWHRKQ